MASRDLHFRFLGDTPLGAELHGRAEFERWFEQLYARFPGIHMELTDVVVGGWPWRTTVAVKLDITAPLADRSLYTNQAVQWVRLRWGTMTHDEVYEDTKALDAACRIQDAATA